MSAGRAGAAALALLMGGCFFWGWDEDHLDVDAISVESILVAGESTATVVVGYPHRAAPKHSPPEVQVELAGPGWHVPALAGSYYHCPIGPWYWPSAVREDVPMACLIADLPEPIREGVSYELKGVGPNGAFSGEVVVPAAPAILDPADTILLERPPGPTGSFEVPIRYRALEELGGLRPEMLASYHDGSRWFPMSPYTEMDVNGEHVTLRVEMDSFTVANIEGGSIHLLGLGSRYAEFLQMDGRIRAPWELGITGDRVFGYFDGAAASSPPLEFVVQDGKPSMGAVRLDSVRTARRYPE